MDAKTVLREAAKMVVLMVYKTDGMLAGKLDSLLVVMKVERSVVETVDKLEPLTALTMVADLVLI